MPLSKLQFRPGINKESTSYANEGTFYDCNWVRFRSGYPEKIGGWKNLHYESDFKGVARAIHSWITYAGEKLLGIGTSQKYYIEHGRTYHDITPVRLTTATLTDPFATTNGSRLVTVTYNAHTATVGTFVTISGAAAVAGLTLNGEYEIISTPSGNTFTIAASSAANATTSGGGAAVVIKFDINGGVGGSTVTSGGWSAGGWGTGGWGEGIGDVVTSGASIPIRLWSHGNYGEDLLLAPRGGEIYYWVADTTTDPFARAVSLRSRTFDMPKLAIYDPVGDENSANITVTDTTGLYVGAMISGSNIPEDTYISAIDFVNKVLTLSANPTDALSGTYVIHYVSYAVPTKTEAVFQSDVYKFTVALGSNPYTAAAAVTDYATDYNPMLVRWSDQDNCYEWIPSSTNQAGEKVLSIGSYLVCAQNTRQEILLWTDAALYSMQYLGPPYTFGFFMLADNISIASPNAAVTANNITYWMGVDKFYTYSGRVDTLPCTLRQYIFGDINRDQMAQVVSGTNEGFNEVWWFYPSKDSSVNDRYVIYNHLEKLWYYGNLNRTAWQDSPLRESPMAAFSVQNTYLSGAINSSVDEIPALNIQTYPASGAIVIDGEEITYASLGGSSFKGCVRGCNGTAAASHEAYAPITNRVTNQIMFHEQGVDDNSLSVEQPIYSYIASGDFDIGDGHNFGFVWRILPDLTFENSTVNNPKVVLTMQARPNSGDSYDSDGTPVVTRTSRVPVEQYDGQVYTRIRGRQMRFKIESTELGVAWQLGLMRIDIRPDGRRS